MNSKLESFKKDIRNKKVAVLGIGISNTPLIIYLAKMGVDVTAFDRSDKELLRGKVAELEKYNVKFSLGENYLKKLKGFDIIFKTPVIRPDIAELLEERERGAVITSEMEVFFELCPAEIFAVTGSDGKTTTTTLIYKMLEEEGYKCWLGGNIGNPLLDRIDEVRQSDKVVLELSSFQLQTMRRSPNTAVITNLSPNHLDVHKSMEEYIDAKKNIFKYQTASDKLVINYDNTITRSFESEVRGSNTFFSREGQLEEGTFARNGKIIHRHGEKETEVVDCDDILLPGVHNIENYLAAVSAVINQVSIKAIRNVASNFKGVEHRIEQVRELNGIKFYNSSIDSSPSRTIACLKSFKQKVILIAGGKDKGIPYDEIGEPIIDRVKCLILTGATAAKIEKALKNAITKTGKGEDITVIKCDVFEEAVKTAYSKAKSGDIVVLSPASTSFDAFKNFEERGRKFKEIVSKL